MNTKLRGTGVAMITPFNSNMEIDFSALEKLVNDLIAGGVNYLVVMGTTGESVTLTKEEKNSIFDFVKKINAGRVPIVAGIGGNNTAEVLEHLKSFNFEGIEAILSVSPYYNKPNQEGIFRHYTAIADAAPRPVILYNVPGRTGSNMTAATTLRLAEHENIIGTKEASGNLDQCMEIISKRPEGFLVISGDDSYTLPYISIGMDGVISVIGNAYPSDFSKMVKLCLDGDFVEAKKLHYRLLELMNVIFADGNPGGIKAVLEEMGKCKNEVRMPLSVVNQTVNEKIKVLVSSY